MKSRGLKEFEGELDMCKKLIPIDLSLLLDNLEKRKIGHSYTIK